MTVFAKLLAMTLAASACAGLMASGAAAQDYPSRTIRLIVPYAAGNGTDRLGNVLGQTFGVENKAGAETVAGAAVAAAARPDGYTLLFSTNATHCAAPNLLKSLPFDPQTDLVPIAFIGEISQLLPVPEFSRWKTVDDLVAAAKKDPGKLTSATPTSTTKFAMGLFTSMTGTEILQVPYSGTQQALNDLSTDQVSIMFNSYSTTKPYLDQKTVRALATTMNERLPDFPDLPALTEQYPGYFSTAWIALTAPKGIPNEIVARLNDAIREAPGSPDMRDRFKAMTYRVLPMSTADVRTYIDTCHKRWAAVAKEQNWVAQ